MKNEVFYMLCSYCEGETDEILGVFTSVFLAKESAERLPALGGNRQVMIVELPVNEDIALCGMSDADLLQYPIHYLTDALARRTARKGFPVNRHNHS